MNNTTLPQKRRFRPAFESSCLRNVPSRRERSSLARLLGADHQAVAYQYAEPAARRKRENVVGVAGIRPEPCKGQDRFAEPLDGFFRGCAEQATGELRCWRRLRRTGPAVGLGGRGSLCRRHIRERLVVRARPAFVEDDCPGVGEGQLDCARRFRTSSIAGRRGSTFNRTGLPGGCGFHSSEARLHGAARSLHGSAGFRRSSGAEPVLGQPLRG